MTVKPRVTLSSRLLLALGLASVVFWVAMAGLTTRDNIVGVNELYDGHLARTAKAFLHLMDADLDAPHPMPTSLSSTEIEQRFHGWMTPPAAHADNAEHLKTPVTQSNLQEFTHLHHGEQLRYQLWGDDGRLIFRSDNAPHSMMTAQPGLSDSVDAQEQGWRHVKVYDPLHKVSVIVSEPRAFRQQLVRNMLLGAGLPLLLGLPVLLGLLWFSITRGLQPLSALSQEIARRQSDNLTPIDPTQVPAELQIIVTTLNDLLKRMADTLENERRFTDDAAHQLRTPLAALQAQLYTVRHAQDLATQQAPLEQLQHGIDRSIRLVNQLLALARLNPQQAEPDFRALQLGELAESVCAELAGRALHKQQTLELQASPGLPAVRGNADMLTMLLANLLDNAIHYTQPGGQITVSLTPERSGVLLQVSDNGPGIASEQRKQVLKRFYRVTPQQQSGTGLGLTICQRIAELHHAPLRLTDGAQGQGLTVKLHLRAQLGANFTTHLAARTGADPAQ